MPRLGTTHRCKDDHRWIYIGKDGKGYLHFARYINDSFGGFWNYRAKDKETLEKKFPRINI